jgi:hypothetical protein
MYAKIDIENQYFTLTAKNFTSFLVKKKMPFSHSLGRRGDSSAGC